MGNAEDKQSSRARVFLPRLEHAQLSQFSLFSRNDEVTLEVRNGVHCLAGANGIGKSTFLAGVAYALTGLVPDPSRNFESLPKFRQEGQAFAEKYFGGRINEVDREDAFVRVTFLLRDVRITVQRSMFDSTDVQRVEIVPVEQPERQVPIKPPDKASDLKAFYENQCTSLAGLDSFDQFLFIVHFILSFDERRTLIFWDRRLLEYSLHLAFGTSTKAAQRASELRDQVEKEGSRARNAKFAATQIEQQMKNLKAAVQELQADDLEDVEKAHRTLVEHFEVESNNVRDAEALLRNLDLEVAQLSASQERLREEYESAFAQSFVVTTSPSHHPLIVETFRARKCAMCGNDDAAVVTHIRKTLAAKKCPLCVSPLSAADSTDSFANLKKLDEQLSGVREMLVDRLKGRDRAAKAVARCRAVLDEAVARLASFEERNTRALTAIGQNDTSGVENAIIGMSKKAESLIQRSKDYYKQRDKLKRQLGRLRDELESQYNAAEEHFVPLFKDLAEEFLGLDLSVSLATSGDDLVSLTLEVGKAHRQFAYQLSESQRFFVDIALRMALIRYMTGGSGRATLLLDTPEGALDIAYEAQAGEMIYKFNEGGYSVLMTANVNSSQLLLRLAARCGAARMLVTRMTEWTELSDVQRSQEILFDKAYREIDDALRTGPAQ